MAQALVGIQDVKISKNPVQAGESFVISVTALFFEPEEPKRRLPFRPGKRKEVD